MPLQFNPAITDRFDNPADYARFHHKNVETTQQIGYVRFSLWKNAAAQTGGKQSVGFMEIPLGGSYIEDGDGCLTQAKFSDVYAKTEEQIETQFKTDSRKIKVTGGVICDLANASVV